MVKRALSFLASLAVLGAGGYAAIRLVVAGVRTFQGLDKQVAAALVAGFASVAVATFTVVGGRLLERRASREAALREKKTEIYEIFIPGMFDIFDLGKQSAGESPEAKTARMVTFFSQVTPQLVAWASDDVIAAWSATRRGASDADGIESLLKFERVLREIRKDLGHSGRRLADGDLLGLFVNDLDEHLPSTKSP